jgi:hypothetical protein
MENVCEKERERESEFYTLPNVMLLIKLHLIPATAMKKEKKTRSGIYFI